MPVHVQLTDDATAVDGCPTRVIVGRRHRLLQEDVLERVPEDLRDVWPKMVQAVDPGDDGRTTTAWSQAGKIVVGVVPERCSRHNTPTRAWSLARLVKHGGQKDLGVTIALDEPEHAWAAAMALGRAHPSWSATSRTVDRTIHGLLLSPGPTPSTDRLQVALEARRRTAALVDMAPNELTTTALLQACRDVADEVGAAITVIEGEELREQGFGGLWGVGKAATHPPALAVMSYRPPVPSGPSYGWVGKGIVYDTGGLSLKSKTGMVGMKGDMGGAAAVLQAFWAAARLGLPRRITAAICIADNAIGPAATRPDDILHMYSGRTVEVNNTDAEGRLVMADGLAYLARHHTPDVLVDCATLTGAQLVATGKRHAALYCNDAELEDQAVDLGRRTGDLVHPLPFAPEFYRKEFASQVADLRNSVKDRANAQSSCAGQFLLEHLQDYEGRWLHVDLAGPSKASGRGTGFGIGVLLGLAGLLAEPADG
jgi:probable aminopeptidase NPEPL1